MLALPSKSGGGLAVTERTLMDDFVMTSECNHRHGEIMDAIRLVSDRLEETNNRLYRDNGKRSIQTITNDHDKVIRGITWAITIIGFAVLTGAVGFIYLLLQKRFI